MKSGYKVYTSVDSFLLQFQLYQNKPFKMQFRSTDVIDELKPLQNFNKILPYNNKYTRTFAFLVEW